MKTTHGLDGQHQEVDRTLRGRVSQNDRGQKQRIEYKLAVLVYRCLHGSAPPYLASDLQRVADLGDRRRLRSSLTDALNVPSTRLSTVGDCAFPVAAARVWNSLPATVASSSSLLTFKRRLKTELFARSYPDC